MTPLNKSGAPFSATLEHREVLDTYSATTIEDRRIPKKCIFNNFGYRAKRRAVELFGIIRTYEKPFNNYYLVITPYGRRKGMSMPEVVKIVKRYGCERVLITLEKKDKKGKPINPHYNIIITT